MMRAFAVLLTQHLKRERWMLPIWIGGIALLGLAAAAGVVDQFGTEAERAAIVAVAVANPAYLFLRGLPDGLNIGSVVFFQAFSLMAVLAGLMSTFLVVRHSRADEELGRAELVASTPVSRATALAVTITIGVSANVILAAVVALGLAAAGLEWEGSLVAGAAVGAVGITFAGAAACVAQLMPTSRSANGLSGALVGGAYLVRGIGDALGTPNAALTDVEASWVSRLSPIGWGQASTPFSEPNVAALLVPIAGGLIFAASAIAIRYGRDLGSSVVPVRPGRARARRGGRSILGLAWILQRSALLGWAIGGAVLGFIAGGLGPVIGDAVAGNESLNELIAGLVPGSTADTVDIFTAAILGIAGSLAAAAGVQAVIRLRAEEAEGRAELLLSTPRARVLWHGSTLAIAAISVVVVVGATGLATGIAIAGTSGEASDIGRFLAAGLAHTPAALVFVAATSLVFAVVPRLTAALGWGLLTTGLVIGQFGALFGLPEWAQNLSPFAHTSAMPVEELDVASASILASIALLGVGVSALLFRRRDLAP